MKLRALLAIVAIAATGTAFAATQTTTTTTRHQKVVKKVKKSTHKSTKQQAAVSRHKARRMGASSQHMSGSNAAPDTDLAARERQQRIDEAYESWRSKNR